MHRSEHFSRRAWLRSLSALAVLIIFASCGSDDDNNQTVTIAEELRAVGLGDYLGQEPERTQKRGAWTQYFYDPAEEEAICFEGDQYQLSTHRGTTNNLLIYLEGGGACWSYETCYVTPLAKVTANPALESGIIDPNNADNPFRDWNIVYVPYCDAAVFIGNNIVDYNGRRTIHHGIQNLSAALTVALEEFPNPDLIVVSGSSAGGYGTYAGYAVTRVTYPDNRMLVLNDSGPGLQNPDAPERNAQREADWNFLQYVPPSCTLCETQYTYLSDWAIERDPTLRIGYFSYLQDFVISFFLEVNGDRYEALLREVTGDLHARQPNRFKRFFVTGSSHTALELPDFYTLSLQGVSLRDWTADFITDGPSWVDVVAE